MIQDNGRSRWTFNLRFLRFLAVMAFDFDRLLGRLDRELANTAQKEEKIISCKMCHHHFSQTFKLFVVRHGDRFSSVRLSGQPAVLFVTKNMLDSFNGTSCSLIS
jgi:hypothetical protein